MLVFVHFGVEIAGIFLSCIFDILIHVLSMILYRTGQCSQALPTASR